MVRAAVGLLAPHRRGERHIGEHVNYRCHPERERVDQRVAPGMHMAVDESGQKRHARGIYDLGSFSIYGVRHARN